MYCKQSNNALRQTKIKKIFNDLAEDYWLNNLFSFGLTAYIRKQAVDKLKIKQNEPVLDIMCGTGDNFKHLFRFTKQITALDYSENMLAIAKQKEKGKKDIDFRKNDFICDNLGDIKFKHCLCTFGLKHLQPEELNKFVEQLQRSLLPQGTFCLSEINIEKNNFLSRLILYYMYYVLPVLNKLFTNRNPHKYLYEFAKNPVSVNQITQLLKAHHFEVNMEYIAFRKAVIISGRLIG